MKDFCVALGVRRPESVKWGLRPPFAPLVGDKKVAAPNRRQESRRSQANDPDQLGLISKLAGSTSD